MLCITILLAKTKCGCNNGSNVNLHRNENCAKIKAELLKPFTHHVLVFCYMFKRCFQCQFGIFESQGSISTQLLRIRKRWKKSFHALMRHFAVA